MRLLAILIIWIFVCSNSFANEANEIPIGGNSARQVSFGDGDSLRLLLSTKTLGSDGVEIARLTLPGGDGQTCASKPCPDHQHPVDEIFYVLSGRLEHIVNGESYVVEPGMLAIAPKDQSVVHNVLSEEPLVVLIIWMATGEFDRIIEHYGLQEVGDSDESGQQSPPFDITAIDGQRITRSAAAEQKPIYLKFWATWCIACIEEMPHFNDAYDRFGDGIQFVAVNVAFNDSLDRIRGAQSEHELGMPVVYDESGEMWSKFDIFGTPTHVLIDRSGKTIHTGYAADEQLDKALASAYQGEAK